MPATNRKPRRRSPRDGSGFQISGTKSRRPAGTGGSFDREAWKAEKELEAAAALETVLGMFRSEELPELITQTMIVRLEGSSPLTNWSMGNQLLALAAGTTDARGFQQWKEVGRSVVKGSRAFRILAPVTIKVTEDDGTEGRRVVGFKLIPVFRVQDTEGMPLEGALDYAPAELPPLFDVAGRLGVKVDYMPAHAAAGYRGFYAPGSGEIALLTHDERTFFHELAHAAHDRVCRASGRTLDSLTPDDCEIVAETVAAVLCKLWDRDGYIGHSHRYVTRFAGGQDAATAAMRLLTDIQKVLFLIIDPPELG